MFKRASGGGNDQDDFIDIGERLAPYASADVASQEPVADAPAMHLAKAAALPDTASTPPVAVVGS